MTRSDSFTDTVTFTHTHAVHIAAKVATDLKRIQRFYYAPSDERIRLFEIEVIELLQKGYMDTVTYGFRRDDCWIEPTLRYTARDLDGATADDDDPGRIKPGSSIYGASFYSYLTYSPTWNRLCPEEREEFNRRRPFPRYTRPELSVIGDWSKDLIYSAGDRALDRASLRSRL